MKKKHKKRLGTNGPVSSIEVKDLNDTDKSETVRETIPIDDKSGTEVANASGEKTMSEAKKTVGQEPQHEVGENVSIMKQSNEDDTAKKEIRKFTDMSTEQQDEQANKNEEEIIEGKQHNDADTSHQKANNDENSVDKEEIAFEHESDEETCNRLNVKRKESKV